MHHGHVFGLALHIVGQQVGLDAQAFGMCGCSIECIIGTRNHPNLMS